MTDYTPYRDQEQPTDGAGQEVVQADQNTANDKSINKQDTLAITGNTTLTDPQFHEVGFLELTGTPGAPFDLNFPALTTNGGTAAHMRKTIKNSTDDVATIQVTGGGGASVTLTIGQTVGVQTDGTDVIQVHGLNKFTSSNQTITAAGSLTIAHGLNASPFGIQARLVCTDAGGEHNYAQNDEVILFGAQDADRGVSLVPDSTNINVRFGSAASTFTVHDKTSGDSANITNSKWALKLYAWV